MAALNYAVEYGNALAQAYPHSLHYGALYSTPNNGRYRWINSKTIEIPNITTTGRVDASRDVIGTAARNYDNAWEPKVLTNQRKWSTLVHPMDIDQTNHVASIQNITQVMNQEQKFPEMDAYTISQLYKLWVAEHMTADTTALTAGNILSIFDAMMQKMDEALVPADGRILYIDVPTNTLLKNASGLTRNYDVQKKSTAIERGVSRIGEVSIEPVPSILMKSDYTFTTGWAPTSGAKQIHMFLVHPSAVITPVSYQFAQLDAPSAKTEGKYYYYEESFEDVFILNKRKDALQFVMDA
jgi:hypothetical protein